MKKNIFHCLKLFICVIFYSSNTQLLAQNALTSQAEAQALQEKANKLVIGKWWNGMEMGGITLEISPENTYQITDDVQGEVTEKGKWAITKTTLTLISEQKNKTVLSYVTDGKVESRSKIALRGKGCSNFQGYCYFKIQ